MACVEARIGKSSNGSISEHEPGRLAVEIKDGSGMPAEDRGGAELVDRAAERREDGFGFARTRNDHGNDGRAQETRDRQGVGMLGNFVDVLEAAVVKLLGTASGIEPDDLDEDG